MGRPRKTRRQYIKEYWDVIAEIKAGTPYRTIAKTYGVGLSTIQRLANKHFWLFELGNTY